MELEERERQRERRRDKRVELGGSEAHSLSSSVLLREGKQRYETEKDNGGQTNESVRDIMNSRTLMRPIYCRQEGRRGEERRGEERRGEERRGKERKGKERKGKERKGKEKGTKTQRHKYTDTHRSSGIHDLEVDV